MSTLSPDDIIDVLARAAIGDADARVDVDPDALDEPLALIGNAVNLLLEDLDYRQREREAALQKAAAAEAKKEFFAYLSHDMQTPLAILMGYLYLIEDGVEQDELPEIVTAMRRAGRSLERHVNQFLDLARLEADRPIEIDAAPVDIVGVCEVVAELFAAEDRVRVEVADEQVRPAYGDEERIERILANLVSNGLKYSRPQEPVTIRVDGEGDEVRVDVVDVGPGMTDDQLRLAFEKFERADTDWSTTGSGLGLFVSRQLAELQDGQLTAESTVGEGSRFTLRLPTAPDEGARSSSGDGEAVG